MSPWIWKYPPGDGPGGADVEGHGLPVPELEAHARRLAEDDAEADVVVAFGEGQAGQAAEEDQNERRFFHF